MPLTSTGFNARRFTEIRSEMFEEMSANLAVELDTSPNQILSIITQVFATSVSDIEELAQAVADSFNVDKAEGKFLDDLVALIRLRRLTEGASTGVIHLTTTNNSSTVPVGSLFSDSQGNQYSNSIAADVSNLEATTVLLTPTNDQGIFSVVVNGVTYSVTFQSPTTATGVVNGLFSEIISAAVTDFNVEVVDDISLRFEIVDKSNTFSVIPNPNLEVTQIEVPILVTATEVGEVDPEVGTVNTVVSNLTGSVSLTNYFSLSVGRLDETDEELRVRQAGSTQIAGNATAAAMFSKLSNITGVSQVRVFENKTSSTNSSGLPPKSFECIVQGGDEQTIAETIYSTAPLGVETYGEISSIVLDYVGNNEAVLWSRPTTRFINVEVSFERYLEESFPDDGVQSIIDAVVEYGNALTLDEDVIPQRFLKPIYNTVDGIGEMTVRVGASVNPSSPTPDDVPYSESRLEVDGRTLADFDAVRIQVIQL